MEKPLERGEVINVNIKRLIAEVIEKNPHIAAIIVDQDGIVRFINDTYLKALKMSSDQVIGQDIRKITPYSRTTKAIETGQPQLAYNWSVHGRQGVACSVPLFENDKVIGAFAYSIFLDIWDKKLREQVLMDIIGNKDFPEEGFYTRYSFDSIIGKDPGFVNLKCVAQNIAYHDNVTVLITGESGTGKDLFAQAIHQSSNRRAFPFVRINCAGIPHNLMESELFGYEEGAYTGARRGGKAGKLELAHNGTVFFDEIGELPLSMQSKLLTFIQEREVERLGSNRPLRINVRIIAATNRNLEKMMHEDKFREDLYYRLNVIRIEVPPLRLRKGDVALLAQHFINKTNQKLGLAIENISDQAMEMLIKHTWPGNVRELENVIERGMILADVEGISVLMPRHLSFLPPHPQLLSDEDLEEEPGEIRDLKTMVNEFEKKVLQQVLRDTQGDKVLAAKYLNINLSSLYRKAKKYEIDL
jgi:transcriptional regulator with PAS, ATPase and Fis domain